MRPSCPWRGRCSRCRPAAWFCPSGLSRPARPASANANRTAPFTAASASSVSACAVRITGQTPPISASAISKAASAFMRRSSRIASASSLFTAAAWPWSLRSAAKCCSGFARSSRRSRSGSRTDQFPKIRRAFGQEFTSVLIDRSLGKDTFEGFEVGRRYLGQPVGYARPSRSGSLNRGAVFIRSASAAPLAAAALPICGRPS